MKPLGDLAAIAAGAALVLAFAPWSIWPLLPLGLAGLFWLCAEVSPRRAAWRGFLFGLGTFGLGVSWVQVSIHLFGGVGPVLAWVITAGFVLVLSGFPALALWAARRFSAPGCSYAFAAAGAWVLQEWLRSWLFTGFPWLSLGYSQLQGPLAGLAPIGGVFLVSLVLAVLAACLYLLIRASRAERVTAVLAIVGLLLFGQWLRSVEWTQPTGQTLSAALVQPNISQDQKWRPEQLAPTLALFATATQAAADADIVVWPETAIPAFYHQIRGNYIKPLADQLSAQGGTLVFGVPQRHGSRPRNVLVSIGPQGQAMYAKRHLVPFGEYLPFDRWLRPVLDWIQIPMSNFAPGDQSAPSLLVGDGLKAAVSICYEDAFGRDALSALPAAGLLLNVSNDAWFGDSLAPHQHLQIARFRALETGRPMLRATNTGISAIINHRGVEKARAEMFQATTLRGDIDVRQGATPYVHGGDTPPLFAALFLFVSGLFGRHKEKGRR